MSREITHVPDTLHDGTPYLRQVVSAARLRAILRADGDTTARPADWGPNDEWVVQ